MAIIKKHDFVEIEYTARTKEDNAVFDTTQEAVAKKEGVYNKNNDYSPLIISLGENTILKALDEQLIGKETGSEYTFEISAENAFGKKDARLLQMIPLSKFRQQNIQPVPGLQLNIDGVFGIVKTVSGGRCYVDFNNPLSGRDIVYNVKVNRIVEDDKEKLSSLLKLHLPIKDAEVEVKDGSAVIKSKSEIPKEAQEEFKKIVGRTIPAIKGIEFIYNKQENK
ncbi:FKBP-type peptidyl-prolyl cis-trans isomerase [Candidatus Woesearchaeota archaeon]|nr:FKBP-type peptidyl-prolyl cis-trans isomerase [Candidatus Woesearchaeota archaeon]